MRQYIGNIAQELGLQAAGSDYARFIILGRSRVGSNLLRSLLNAHSQIEVYGELFRSRESLDFDHLNSLQAEEALQLFQQQPVEFIQTKIFRSYPTRLKAIGFKIFYYHAAVGDWTAGWPYAVWPYLEAETELRVLHIKRRNILKTHLSREKAQVTNSWVNQTGQAEKPVSIPLDYEALKADFEQTRAFEADFDGRFAHHPLHEVIYEELAADYAGVMGPVQAFLGVKPEPVAPSIYKQSSQPLSEAITNYDELKTRFQGTEWASFFEE
jgi:LPS sulfotransferase NodH